MIIVRLTGGLGNQMFQYATAKGYQRNENEQIILDDRLLLPLESDIDKIIQRPYALSIFKNIDAIVMPAKLNSILSGKTLFNRFKRKLFNNQAGRFVQHLMNPIVLTKSNKNNVLLTGDFQSEEYFAHIRKTIINNFEFPLLDVENDLIKRMIDKAANSLSIHVRRGDYLSVLNKGVFNSLNLSYYYKAFTYLQSKIGEANLQTFIFTDDIKWVKENLNLTGHDVFFVEGNHGENSWKDMYLMSRCKNHIIANSSFSWWGAWLATNAGINIAPRHWYVPNSNPYDINHIIPAEWVILDYDT